MTDHEIDYQITDPTSVFTMNGKWYLTTTESSERWLHGGVSILNRIYEFNPVMSKVKSS